MQALTEPCPAARHDTRSAYMYGCRCPAAREAQRLYVKRRKVNRQPPGLVDATGTIRRIQALRAIGWPISTLPVHNERIPRLTYVRADTAERVKTFYDTHSMTPGPSQRARTCGRQYAPPLAWDEDTIDDPTAEPYRKGTPLPANFVDEVKVIRLLQGERIKTSQDEKREAVRRLHGAGLSRTEMSKRLRMSGRAINQALRKAA